MELTYEQAYEKLEDILKKLESNEYSLDVSLRLYEDGVNLYRYCNNLIEKANLEITKIDEKGNEVEFILREDI